MTPIDYGALGADTGAGGVPDDGEHIARLERAALVETQNGERLVTEWSNQEHLWWTSWNRFDASGMSWTQELLDGLGVDRKNVHDDEEMEMALAEAVGRRYRVKTESKQGNQGDRWFTSTYVQEEITNPQTQLTDTPADTTGLPQAGVGASASAPSSDDPDDDDIPF
jgi:hypothetical protein